MGKFSDVPHFILEEFVGDLKPYGYTLEKKAHLRGPNSGMVARFGYGIELYLKTESGYGRVKAIPVDGTPTGNEFQYRLITDGYRSSEFSWADLDTYAGSEVYFRKDVQFHDYVDNNPDWKGYLNTNKTYVYFGKIYRTSTYPIFTVHFHGMKDYVVSCLPTNNQTDNMVEFLSVYFDKIYSEVYNLIKQVWTLSDPMEVDINYLYYISNMYRMNLYNNLTEDQRRRFVSYLPYLLKRKGSYTSLYIIWKALLGRTTNYLNVYERWHPVIEDTEIPYSYFEDILYTTFTDYGLSGQNLPVDGAGEGFYYSSATSGSEGYPTYSVALSATVGKVLSPHYRVEIDLSNQPLGQSYIIDETTIDTLITAWETMRPVARVSHYSELIAPLANFTQSWRSLYGSSYAAFMFSRCCQPIASALENCAVYSRSSASEMWIVEHGLNSADVVVQCYDSEKNFILPKEVEYYSMNAVKITWDHAQSGTCFVSKPDYTLSALAPSASWIVEHSIGERYLLAQANTSTHSQFIPLSVLALSPTEMVVNLVSSTSGYFSVVEPEFRYTQSDPAEEWMVYHGFDAWAIQVQVFDGSDELIYPKEITINTSNTVNVTFSEPVSGTAVIKKIGQTGNTMETLFDTISYAQVGGGDDTRHWDARYENALKSPYFNCAVTKSEDGTFYYGTINIGKTTDDLNITEIGLFDTNDDIAWYTACSTLHKPADVTLKIFYRIEKTS